MRLSEQYVKNIKEIFQKYFLPEDHLWVFGSRVYDCKKGGDIDLYIETNYKEAKMVTQAERRFWGDLQIKLGEQKIDIVIKFNDFNLPIYDIAKKEGVKLI